MHLLLMRSRIVWTRIGRTLDMDIKGSACWSPCIIVQVQVVIRACMRTHNSVRLRRLRGRGVRHWRRDFERWDSEFRLAQGRRSRRSACCRRRRCACSRRPFHIANTSPGRLRYRRKPAPSNRPLWSCPDPPLQQSQNTCLSNAHSVNKYSIVYGYSSSQSNLPHRYGNSHATWDHTVLPATRQRWPSCLYPSRSWYSI